MNTLQPTIKISLTDFINFILGGTSKDALVRQIISRQKKKDFFSSYYLPLQQGIIAYHQNDRDPSKLQNAIDGLNTKDRFYNNKVETYKLLRYNYLQLEPCKTKTCKYLEPPNGSFSHKNLTITLKP